MAKKGKRVVKPAEGIEPAEHHGQSPTAIAAESLSTGVRPPTPTVARGQDASRDANLLRAGDIDTDPMQNAHVGDETPGGDTPTPDQDLVDEIGRAYGVSEADSGALRTSSELLDERDRRRAELDGPRPAHGTREEDRERENT
jgi:hypothetical protein